ncbi:MAG TPA: hypothetical protein VGM42_12515 [Rhodopila sp.]
MPQPPPYSPFRERLITYLLPYFLPLTSDFERAHQEALETLESYGARTRAEMINAMRIIALSFASMELLATAKGPDMPPDMRLQYIRHANGLARICQQSENALAKRLTADPPQPADPTAEPIDDISDAEVEALIQQTRAQIIAYRKSIPEPPPRTTTRPPMSTAQGVLRPTAPA